MHISRIKMRGFKSFKLADIIFPRDFVCLAGPNGSGKSNVCDAIRFAFGEISLKALRAKKVKELISHSAKMAEVSVYLEGESKHEIRRVIRDDGKIMYRLDGERTTRTSILDLLKKFNIDESGRNTIAQGEVQRIVTMAAKDRRGIIDSVAGISEFEDKKEEALRDLEVVETRLREAELILGEKLGMLEELGKEKEIALKYIENRKQFANARGSLVKKEMEKFEGELEKAVNDLQKMNNSLKAKGTELAELEAKIKAHAQEKGTFLEEIEKRQQQSETAKKIEALRLAIGKDSQELEEKNAFASRLEADIAAAKEETKKEAEELKKTTEELGKVEEELATLKPRAQEAEKATAQSRLGNAIVEGKMKIASMREDFIRVESEISACTQLALEKESSLAVPEMDDPGQEEKLASETEILKKEVEMAKAGLELLFEREKEANAEIADMDRRILSLREKIASLRAQNPRLASNAVMDFIRKTTARERNAGVHGALIDLIAFDAKYANAIEAAAGPRLLYIVVDDAETATWLIAKIKENGAGRATFIPLKEVKTGNAAKGEGLGPLLDYVKCDAGVEKAAQYALGETVLVSDMAEAKKIGVGKHRMVTLDGEIFEKSGVITGGKTSTGIAAAGALSKHEAEISDLKAARESVFAEIAGIREQMSILRSQRAEKEVRAKSLVMELAALRAEDEKAKKTQEEAAKKTAEIEALKARANGLVSRKAELESAIAALSEKIAKDEKALSAEEEQAAKQNKEARRKHTETVAKISALEVRRDAIFNEIKLRKTNHHKSESRHKQMTAEKSAYISKASEIERRLLNQKGGLEKLEAELASSSRDLEALFRKMKESEEKITAMGKEKGAIAAETEKYMKEANNLNVKKATAETKLADLKAEFDSFREFEFLDLSKERLVEIAKSADAFLAANQAVNLASVELYEKKNAEIGNVKERMEKLKAEKEAVMGMITEIDARKKETFFSTFYAVSDNFRKMFRYILHVGEGFLYLDKPNEPFESGLYLRIKRGTKEMGLESLSGGENSLIALMFIFALQFVKPSPYYVLDEVDSSLDKENSKNLAKLIKEMSKNSQFILVTHNDMVMRFASAVFGVSKSDGVSRIVGVKFEEKMENAPAAPEVLV